ncbi:hypothetical protein [Chitiniphilus eburneus]|uniref:Uncharacterized protein n=1 Tax=Chitiniphilus eburneus TaxID=2571148 RepID=A0A4U0PTE5_9NEIS|nr:hypothetical protein [Chitiniphilus eburneus]TJZ71706.1 hypothetical protein FAZ21_13440 [Chitiniphilus eburneus]
MTAIAIWQSTLRDNSSILYAAGDSLISNGTSHLIGDASKIFPLQVTCRIPNKDGVFSLVSSNHVYGYAFAGSTLLGQNSYLSLTPLLSNLYSLQDFTPSLENISLYVLDFLRTIYDDAKIRGPSTAFEVALFGYCPISQKMEIYHFKPIRTELDGSEIQRNTYRHLKHGDYVYLGSNKNEFEDALSIARQGPTAPGFPMTNAPRYVIERFINEKSFPQIGGGLQLWSIDPTGIFPYTLSRPINPGSPAAKFTYLGHVLGDSLQNLGPAWIGMRGMA